MTLTSGSNPFKNPNSGQRIPTVPRDFIRSDSSETQSLCMTGLVSQTGPLDFNSDFSFTLNWINTTTGDKMDIPTGSISPRSAVGSWNSPPSLGCHSGTPRTCADETQSVNFSAAGQEFVDFHSSSSDTGHSSYAYMDPEHGSHFQSAINDIPVSGPMLAGPLPATHNESCFEDASYYHPSRLVTASEISGLDMVATGLPQYEQNYVNLGSRVFAEYTEDSPPSDESMDHVFSTDGLTELQDPPYVADMQDLDYYRSPDAYARIGATQDDLLVTGSPFEVLDWDQTGATHSSGNEYLGAAFQEQVKTLRQVRELKPRPENATGERAEPAADNDNARRTESTKAKKTSEPRNDPLYQAKPGSDGYYHCPWKEKEKCSHTKTKQKCTYDKHVDAHLKPYLCKRPECSKLKFSSNAVLGRHERETHGMHGHGSKPYPCLFDDCKRSTEDAGFPRRWNCRDHMRRVHGVEVAGEDDDDEDYEIAKALLLESRPQRKGTTSRNGVPMKKTASSQSKRSTKSNRETRASIARTSEHSALSIRRQTFPTQQVVPDYVNYHEVTDSFSPADYLAQYSTGADNVHWPVNY